MSRDKYSTLLGMDLGTASNRLKKQIFLQMAAELGRDLCLKCNLRIENAEDLSVDHIKPWRGADPKLFWDLSNIAFSHRKCNIAAIGILLIGIVSIDAYIASRLYVVPAAVGGGIGTYWTVKREKRKRE
jgi:hypothetical protein